MRPSKHGPTGVHTHLHPLPLHCIAPSLDALPQVAPARDALPSKYVYMLIGCSFLFPIGYLVDSFSKEPAQAALDLKLWRVKVPALAAHGPTRVSGVADTTLQHSRRCLPSPTPSPSTILLWMFSKIVLSNAGIPRPFQMPPYSPGTTYLMRLHDCAIPSDWPGLLLGVVLGYHCPADMEVRRGSHDPHRRKGSLTRRRQTAEGAPVSPDVNLCSGGEKDGMNCKNLSVIPAAVGGLRRILPHIYPPCTIAASSSVPVRGLVVTTASHNVDPSTNEAVPAASDLPATAETSRRWLLPSSSHSAAPPSRNSLPQHIVCKSVSPLSSLLFLCLLSRSLFQELGIRNPRLGSCAKC